MKTEAAKKQAEMIDEMRKSDEELFKRMSELFTKVMDGVNRKLGDLKNRSFAGGGGGGGGGTGQDGRRRRLPSQPGDPGKPGGRRTGKQRQGDAGRVEVWRQDVATRWSASRPCAAAAAATRRKKRRSSLFYRQLGDGATEGSPAHNDQEGITVADSKIAYGKGLDVGTCNLVAAEQNEKGEVELRPKRNVFIDVPIDAYTKNMLTRLNVPYVVQGKKMYVLGEPRVRARERAQQEHAPADGGRPDLPEGAGRAAGHEAAHRLDPGRAAHRERGVLLLGAGRPDRQRPVGRVPPRPVRRGAARAWATSPRTSSKATRSRSPSWPKRTSRASASPAAAACSTSASRTSPCRPSTSRRPGRATGSTATSPTRSASSRPRRR